MATLNFKGKTAVWNHHLSVPYCTLEKVKDNSLAGENEDDNLLIEGDNLLALKALLPKYQGKVKCVYIDPPYNTGKEGWAYNDNVSNPVIKEWLGRIVDKEDMTRHDKWLCMMTPRLKLLRELLSDEGLIYVSIGEDAIGYLRILMDEIFGEKNHIGTFIWQKGKEGGNDNDGIGNHHEYIIFYAKSFQEGTATIRLDEKDVSRHITELPGANMVRGIISYTRIGEKFQLINLSKQKDYNLKIPLIDGTDLEWEGYMPQTSLDEAIKIGKVFVGEKGVPYIKSFLADEKDGSKPSSLITQQFGTTKAGGIEMKDLFGVKVFDYPKPSKLIKRLISIASDSSDIVLDSFAGSGTTGQAVLELNQENNGSRKFILVQLPETLTEKAQAKLAGYDFVHEITRDRMKKVIAKNKLGIGFTYYQLGQSIESRKIIEGESLPSWESFAKYIHFLATGKPLDSVILPDVSWEIKTPEKSTGVFLIYKDTIEELKNLAITREWLEIVKEKEGRKFVYAPACFLDKEVLNDYNISFVQIPYNLFQRK